MEEKTPEPNKRYRIHVCQDVDGALRNWTKKQWQSVAKNNGMSIDEAKAEFKKYQAEGKRVIPIGPACEGFSFQTGCPGHEVTEDQANFSPQLSERQIKSLAAQAAHRDRRVED